MEEKRDDLFSNLPDEILCHIISSLPSDIALQTTILVSTRWKHLWNLVLIQQGTLDCIVNAFTHFLTQFDKFDPLKHPRRLQFRFDEGRIMLATISPNNKVQLEFTTEEKHLPVHFEWKLLLNHQNVVTHKPCSSTLFVKSLLLKSVCYLTKDSVSSIVSKLQFLETLKIVECKGLQSLHVESSPKLLNLAIFNCPDLKSICLKCFKLRSFRYRGQLPKIWPEYHFNLTDAMFDFRQGPSQNCCVNSLEFDPTLLTIKNTQVLTLCSWIFEALIWPSILPFEETFRFYKLNELWWIDNLKEDGSYNSNALFSFLKLCPALERLFLTIDSESYFMPSISTYINRKGTSTKLEHLKVVKLEGFTKQGDRISLLKHIRKLFKVEPLIIEASNVTCLLSFVNKPVSSSQETKSSNYISKEVEYIKEICPKHS